MNTIYVSSTYSDLKDHRRALSTAIRRLGHVDIAMEYYVAEDLRPIDRCLKDAASSDLYIGLFARRYGFCPPQSERSITELELREAQRAHVDCLCFFVPDDAQWPEDRVEEGAGAKKLEALRSELEVDYLSGFYTSPDELAAVASAAIVRNFELGKAPFDAMREHRLMKEWRMASKPLERVRAGSALANMGSPRYVSAIKDRLLEAGRVSDVASIARYLEELQWLTASRRELMPIFLDLLEHPDENRRYFTVFQLGELALRGRPLRPEIIDSMLTLAEDASPGVRGQLAHALSKLIPSDAAHPGVVGTLEKLTEDEAEGVREEAKRSVDVLRSRL